MNSLEDLAVEFRFMQLYAHIGHNRVSGPTFFQDHEFLGGLYGTYEEAYDSLVERMIGLGQTPDLKAINDEANSQLQEAETGTISAGYLTKLLECEKEACDDVEEAVSGGEFSEATVNLLVQLADDSEQRQYKIQQRVGRMAVDEKPGDALDRLAAARSRMMKMEGPE